jgi:hypothetical protein
MTLACSLQGKWERCSSQIAVQKQMTRRYEYNCWKYWPFPTPNYNMIIGSIVFFGECPPRMFIRRVAPYIQNMLHLLLFTSTGNHWNLSYIVLCKWKLHELLFFKLQTQYFKQHITRNLFSGKSRVLKHKHRRVNYAIYMVHPQLKKVNLFGSLF